VVFGDTGTGKSSLARLLHQKFLDTQFQSILITNPNYPTQFSFLKTINAEFGIARTDKSFRGTLDLFKDFLFDQAMDQRRTVVLIIDEAQALSTANIELLRQLANYETNDMKLLQIVLFAQEELRNTLAKPKLKNFRSRIVFPSVLMPLSEDELGAMLKFRWEVASGGREHPFEDSAVAAIYRHSGGMPREANILADSALLLAFTQRERQITGDLVEAIAQDRSEALSRKGGR